MNKYEVEKVVGEGSYGRALLCRRKADSKKCIVKQISIVKLSPRERKLTEQESMLLSKLSHPNIVTFIESFMAPNHLNIVMEFADGGDLSNYIKNRRGRHLAEAQVMHMFVQLSLALKHVHDRKILHRDLKSQNVFLTSAGIVKLGDFGVSRVLKNTCELASTQIGTPYYMSPEIMEGKKYNSKTDIWSLGCILYEIACLKLPFDGSSMRQLVYNITHGTPANPPSSYSSELRTLVQETLAKNPKNRPSINAVLSKSVVKQRISNFLNETKLVHEFSHTVLHGVDVLKSNPTPVVSAVPSAKPMGPAPTPALPVAPKPTAAPAQVVPKAVASQPPVVSAAPIAKAPAAAVIAAAPSRPNAAVLAVKNSPVVPMLVPELDRLRYEAKRRQAELDAAYEKLIREKYQNINRKPSVPAAQPVLAAAPAKPAGEVKARLPQPQSDNRSVASAVSRDSNNKARAGPVLDNRKLDAIQQQFEQVKQRVKQNVAVRPISAGGGRAGPVPMPSKVPTPAAGVAQQLEARNNFKAVGMKQPPISAIKPAGYQPPPVLANKGVGPTAPVAVVKPSNNNAVVVPAAVMRQQQQQQVQQQRAFPIAADGKINGNAVPAVKAPPSQPQSQSAAADARVSPGRVITSPFDYVNKMPIAPPQSQPMRVPAADAIVSSKQPSPARAQGPAQATPISQLLKDRSPIAPTGLNRLEQLSVASNESEGSQPSKGPLSAKKVDVQWFRSLEEQMGELQRQVQQIQSNSPKSAASPRPMLFQDKPQVVAPSQGVVRNNSDSELGARGGIAVSAGAPSKVSSSDSIQSAPPMGQKVVSAPTAAAAVPSPQLQLQLPVKDRLELRRLMREQRNAPVHVGKALPRHAMPIIGRSPPASNSVESPSSVASGGSAVSSLSSASAKTPKSSAAGPRGLPRQHGGARGPAAVGTPIPITRPSVPARNTPQQPSPSIDYVEGDGESVSSKKANAAAELKARRDAERAELRKMMKERKRVLHAKPWVGVLDEVSVVDVSDDATTSSDSRAPVDTPPLPVKNAVAGIESRSVASTDMDVRTKNKQTSNSEPVDLAAVSLRKTAWLTPEAVQVTEVQPSDQSKLIENDGASAAPTTGKPHMSQIRAVLLGEEDTDKDQVRDLMTDQMDDESFGSEYDYCPPYTDEPHRISDSSDDTSDADLVSDGDSSMYGSGPLDDENLLEVDMAALAEVAQVDDEGFVHIALSDDAAEEYSKMLSDMQEVLQLSSQKEAAAQDSDHQHLESIAESARENEEDSDFEEESVKLGDVEEEWSAIDGSADDVKGASPEDALWDSLVLNETNIVMGIHKHHDADRHHDSTLFPFYVSDVSNSREDGVDSQGATVNKSVLQSNNQRSPAVAKGQLSMAELEESEDYAEDEFEADDDPDDHLIAQMAGRKESEIFNFLVGKLGEERVTYALELLSAIEDIDESDDDEEEFLNKMEDVLGVGGLRYLELMYKLLTNSI